MSNFGLEIVITHRSIIRIITVDAFRSPHVFLTKVHVYPPTQNSPKHV